MKPNIFYGLLHQLLTESPEFKLLNTSSPVHDKTLEDKEYYRLELPPADIVVDDLEFFEAHMSIYKRVDHHNPSLGPVHFTATFNDADGHEFRMHLFLNQFDSLACPPTWELFNEDHRYVKVDPPASMEYLSHAIWQHGQPYLRELRKQHKNLESRLNKDYEQLEQQVALLHAHLNQNKHTYLESLAALIKSAELLSQISTNRCWSRTVSYLGKSQKLMTSMPEPSIGLGETQHTEKQKKDEEDVSTAPAQNSTHKEKQRRAKTSHSQQILFFQSGKDSSLIDTGIQKQITKIEGLYHKVAMTLDKHIKALMLIDLNHQLINIAKLK